MMNGKETWLTAIIIGMAIIAIIMLASCSCDIQPKTYGNNSLNITYVGYNSSVQMSLDCDWDAKNLTCQKHQLIGSKCVMINCTGNKPTTQRDCEGKK